MSNVIADLFPSTPSIANVILKGLRASIMNLDDSGLQVKAYDINGNQLDGRDASLIGTRWDFIKILTGEVIFSVDFSLGFIPLNSQQIDVIEVGIDGQGSSITTGLYSFKEVPFNGKIIGYTIVADQVGTISVDVKKSNYINFPTNSSITGANPITLTSAQKNKDIVLNNWTLNVSAGDLLQFIVNSASTVIRVQIFLKIQKSL